MKPLALLASLALPTTLANPGGADWRPALAPDERPDAPVHVMHTHLGSAGAEVYVGGSFTAAGARTLRGLALWDGTSLAEVGGGVDGRVYALETFDDGRGPALYVGGEFTLAGGVQASSVARWDGAAWEPLGQGVENAWDNEVYVADLCVFDDGTGPSLYASGLFTHASGSRASMIARWDGHAWHPVGEGMNNRVYELEVFDDGSGPALYAGGVFHYADGVLTPGLARWDGASWSRVGDNIAGNTLDLEVFDDGSGPALYAVGGFVPVPSGSAEFNHVARWDGTTWTPLGQGIDGWTWHGARTLVAHDDGSGPALYVGGYFQVAGAERARNIARWDGHGWSQLGDGVRGSVQSLHSAAGPGGVRSLFVCGELQSPAGDVHFATWRE